MAKKIYIIRLISERLIKLLALRLHGWLNNEASRLYSKTLIVTTAKDLPLTKVWLPSLRQRGEYRGDVLIIDYDLSSHTVRMLQQQPNIVLFKCKAVYKCLASDRHRAFYEALKPIWKKYQTIMIIDGNDVDFFKPIQLLLSMAKEKVCYVTENEVNENSAHYEGPPDTKDVWKCIKNKLIANSGMYVGPSKLIFKIQQHIAENLKYNSDFGADQVLFNSLIHYYKIPSREVDRRWNFICGKGVYDKEYMKLIASYSILHNAWGEAPESLSHAFFRLL